MKPLIALLATLAVGLSWGQSLPEDREYVTVKNGHLAVNGERIRLWCVIGGFPNYADIQPGDDTTTRTAKRDRAYKDAVALVDRFEGLGFNGMRLWEKPQANYTKGDGSPSDVLDYFVSVAKKRGFRVWLPAVSVARVSPDDVGLIDEPATAEAWKAAAKAPGSTWIARIWDPRLEAAQVKEMDRLTNHVNQHTGLRWGDDPIFGIWELTNEEWWMMKMVGGEWTKLPDFFRRSLLSRWQGYLRAKYGSEEKLRARWGFLLPGESLAARTIQLAPMSGGLPTDTSGMDPQARLQVEAARAAGGQSQWTRDDFSRHRGADVLEFFLDMHVKHKDRLRDALKAMGKAARLGPVVYDTGIGYEIQSQFSHQRAEAVAHDAYINGVTPVRQNQRWPWYSGLEEWPRIAQDVPWLEHNRVEGKPFLCYETQIMQPAKYRAEYPLRLLALAAIQDWDAICWHYWGSARDITTNPNPFDKTMDVTTGWHPQGYHYTYDAVQNALMRAAGMAFRAGTLAPAKNPTTFIYGRRSLYDPASMDYGGSYGKIGNRMLPTTYAHGVRVLIDPTREDDAVIGPTIDPLGQALPNLVRSTPQITFDVGRGGLTLDAPGTVGFTGFMSRFGPSLRFRNGLSLSEVKIDVPATMPYRDGIASERYIGFTIASEDGLPLAQTRRATLALKSTSFNSGFRLAEGDKPSVAGELPVLEARVSAVIRGSALRGMKARMLDWHFRDLGELPIGPDGSLRIPSDRPFWVIVLTR